MLLIYVHAQGWPLGEREPLGGSSLGKTDSPSLRSHWLPAALHLGVDSCEISPTHAGMSTDVVTVLVLCKWPGCWDFLGVASLSYLGETVSQQMSWSPNSYSLSACLLGCLSLGLWSCCECISYACLPLPCLCVCFRVCLFSSLIVAVFRTVWDSWDSYLQRTLREKESKTSTILRENDNVLVFSHSHWFWHFCIVIWKLKISLQKENCKFLVLGELLLFLQQLDSLIHQTYAVCLPCACAVLDTGDVAVN